MLNMSHAFTHGTPFVNCTKRSEKWHDHLQTTKISSIIKWENQELQLTLWNHFIQQLTSNSDTPNKINKHYEVLREKSEKNLAGLSVGGDLIGVVVIHPTGVSSASEILMPKVEECLFLLWVPLDSKLPSSSSSSQRLFES
jgi:hypothetical protein